MGVLAHFSEYRRKDFLDKFMTNVKRELKDKKIILYGAGPRGCKLFNIFTEYGIKGGCEYFCDDDKNKHNSIIHGLKVLSFDDAVEKSITEKYSFVIANYSNKIIEKRLIDKGITNIYFYKELLIDIKELSEIKVHEKNIELAYSILSDDKSKLTFMNTLEHIINGDTTKLPITKEFNPYFNFEHMNFNNHEVFADLGAFDGDTVYEFINTVKEYNMIYAFEPDNINYDKLKKNSYKLGSKIQIENLGAYNYNGQIKFEESANESSQICDKGEIIINVTKLDDYFKNIVPTFIKMDIEGAEIPALKGAEHIIKENKPKLAICIYHNFEDLWEIPLLIKRLNSDYKIYIRNYTDSVNEIVCYAIP